MENLYPIPWVPEVVSRLGRGASFHRPQVDTCSRGFVLDLGGWGFSVPLYGVQDCR